MGTGRGREGVYGINVTPDEGWGGAGEEGVQRVGL